MLPLTGAYTATSPRSSLQPARLNVILTALLLIFAIFLTSCGVSGASTYAPSNAKGTNTRRSESPSTREAGSSSFNAAESSSSVQTESSGHITVAATFPHATIGSTYNAVVSVSGGTAPYQFSIFWGALPPGLTINPTTGTISGTPVKSGTYQFGVLATDLPNSDRGDHRMTLVVDVPTVGIVVQVSPANATVVSGGTQQFTATVTGTSNVAVTWSATAGTMSNSGLFTAPVVSAITMATVTATSVVQPSSSDSASVTINPPPPPVPTITTTTIPDATAGVSYLTTLAATGGKLPYQWSITSGKLPSGIQLNGASGSISGLTTATGSFTFNVNVTDAAGQSDQRTFTLRVPASVGNCGPPAYSCARTDLAVAQLPIIPNMGNLTGKDTCINDPDFSSRVCRLTDSTTSGNATIIAHGGGGGDENSFNLDSTKLVVDTTTGVTIPVSFDPVTMVGNKMYGGWSFSLSGNASWSHLNPDLLYAMGPTGQKTAWVSYDTSSPSIPSPVTVYDYRTPNCLGTSFVSTWVGTAGVSKDDTVFVAGFSNNGGQGTGHYVVAYNKTTNTCRMFDVASGVVTGDPGSGPTGAVPNWQTMTDADGILLHSIQLSKDGAWVVINPHVPSCPSCGSGIFFWQIDTLNVTSASGNLGGHSTEGYTHWINNNNSPIGQFQSRLFATPGTRTPIIQNFPLSLAAPFEHHAGWSNVDVNDTYPFFLTEDQPLSLNVPNVAWFKEVLGVSPVTGTVFRFAHTFSSSLSHRFSTKSSVGAISQDGRFFLWSSDWMGTLGSENGASSCTLGTDCRGDVFVVELK
jgi:hypothetical protein